MSHVKFHMWNFKCWNMSHVKFHMWNFTCEISHVKNMSYENFTCEISHVKFHMWNFTCGISHVKFHMWRICHMGNTWVLRFTCVIGTSHVNHMWITWETHHNFLWGATPLGEFTVNGTHFSIALTTFWTLSSPTAGMQPAARIVRVSFGNSRRGAAVNFTGACRQAHIWGLWHVHQNARLYVLLLHRGAEMWMGRQNGTKKIHDLRLLRLVYIHALAY